MSARPGRDSSHVEWSCRVHAAALRLYPRAHRERWGAEMRRTFRERCREAADRKQELYRWLLMVAVPDLLASGFRERFTAFFHFLKGHPMRQFRNLAAGIVLALFGSALVAVSVAGFGYAIVHGRFAHPGAFDALTALQAMAGVAGGLLLAIANRQLRPVVAANLT